MSDGHPKEKSTYGQAARIGEFVREVVPDVLNKTDAQWLIEHGANLFKGQIRTVLGEMLHLDSHESWGMTPLGIQLHNLRVSLPNFRERVFSNECNNPYRGEDRDDLALIPTLSFLGRCFGVGNPYGEWGYTRLVLKMLRVLRARVGLDVSSYDVPSWFRIRLKQDIVKLLRGLESKLRPRHADFLVLPVFLSNDWPTPLPAQPSDSGVYPLCTAQFASMMLAMPERFADPRFSKRFGDCYFSMGDMVNDPGWRNYFTSWYHPRWSSHAMFSLRYLYPQFKVVDSSYAVNANYLMATYPITPESQAA